MSAEFMKNKHNSFKEYLTSDLDINFDLHAQDPNDFTWVEEYFPNFKLLSSGGALPFQAEGYLNGYPFYYRSEQNVANIKVAERDQETPYLPDLAYWSSRMETDDYMGGANFWETMFHLLRTLEKAPFLYEFPCNKIAYRDRNDFLTSYIVEEGGSTVQGWGRTPMEAYNDAMSPSLYLLVHGISFETQEDIWEKKNPSPIPLTEDTRVYLSDLPDIYKS